MAAHSVPFTKMHGCANDYVVVDATRLQADDWGAFAREACDRRHGVGADGLLLAESCAEADLRMRMFNPDGSQAQMCGNGLRCLVRFAREEHLLAPAPSHRIQTQAGVLSVRVWGEDPWDVEIDMGAPRLDPSALPARATGAQVLDLPVEIDGVQLHLTLVSMGNPHAVHFVSDVDAFPLDRIGPQVEQHPLFPERVNFEIVQRVDARRLRQRTWERGVGETPACGTGACAVVVAAVQTGRAEREVVVALRGGELRVFWTPEGSVLLRGPAERVFDGVWNTRGGGARFVTAGAN